MKKKYYDSFAVRDAFFDFMVKVGSMQEADVVEVVRCKDCKWFGALGCISRYTDGLDKPSKMDYCSWGEREEDEE